MIGVTTGDFVALGIPRLGVGRFVFMILGNPRLGARNQILKVYHGLVDEPCFLRLGGRNALTLYQVLVGRHQPHEIDGFYNTATAR